jgi:hypothetical protein
LHAPLVGLDACDHQAAIERQRLLEADLDALADGTRNQAGRVATIAGIRRSVEPTADQDRDIAGVHGVLSLRQAAAPAVGKLPLDGLPTVRARPVVTRLGRTQLFIDQCLGPQGITLILEPELGPAIHEGNLAQGAGESIVADLARNTRRQQYIAQVRDPDDGVGRCGSCAFETRNRIADAVIRRRLPPKGVSEASGRQPPPARRTPTRSCRYAAADAARCRGLRSARAMSRGRSGRRGQS